MPRARIPYDELQRLAEKKYPSPLYIDVEVQRKDRTTDKAPTRVYDRTTGNFAAIGWQVSISFKQFDGIKDMYGEYEAMYVFRRFNDILFTE